METSKALCRQSVGLHFGANGRCSHIDSSRKQLFLDDLEVPQLVLEKVFV